MENSTQKIDLLSLLPEELEAFVISLGEPKYRAKQLFVPLHKGIHFNDITNISKALKAKLDGCAEYLLPCVHTKLVSRIDGTVKYLLELHDGNCIESVVMKYKHGNTICISSQVGCRMGCAFCASTIGGKVRDLLPSELLGQIIVAAADTGEHISNIVMMGIGEPLDNYENVIKFLKLVNCADGLNIGYRHISLSTCGVADKIDALAKESLPITLSISLHAYNDTVRSSIMPINKKWNIERLLASCKSYFLATGRRISFEYTLIAGKNDSKEGALALARLLNSSLRSAEDTMPIHVNLIPVNPVRESDFSSSERHVVEEFAKVLEGKGIRATVRRTLGADINASCGQLRREQIK